MAGGFANILCNRTKSPIPTGNLSPICVHKPVDKQFCHDANAGPACPPNKPHKK